MKNIALSLLLMLAALISPAEDRTRAIDSLQALLACTAPNTTAQVDVLNELSGEFVKMDRYDSALSNAIKAKQISEELHYKNGTSLSFARIALIYHQQGNYPTALQFYLKSLSIADTNDVKSICLLYNNIGSSYYFQKDYMSALRYYHDAMKYNCNAGLTYSNMGLVYNDMKDYTKALYYFSQALAYYTSANDKNASSTLLTNIGDIYESKKEYDKALDYYRKALQVKREIKDNQGEADALGSIGDVYYSLGNYDSALVYEQGSLVIASKINYRISMVQTEQVLSDIYEKLGKGKDSYAHYKTYIALRDSIYNEENTKKTVRTEMNFQFDKQQQLQRTDQDKKDAVTQTIIYSTSAGLAVTLILSFFIFNGYRNKKKLAMIIQQQKESVEKQKQMIEEKQKEVMASIRYAKRIQQSLLPTEIYINKNMERMNSFILKKAS